jgi:multisubunit Na+/H+ antiporter MnhG subunit
MDNETRTAIYVLGTIFGVFLLAWLLQNGRTGVDRLFAASLSVAFLVVTLGGAVSGHRIQVKG